MNTCFHIFRREIEILPYGVEKVVMAAVILHNFLRRESHGLYTRKDALDHETAIFLTCSPIGLPGLIIGYSRRKCMRQYQSFLILSQATARRCVHATHRCCDRATALSTDCGAVGRPKGLATAASQRKSHRNKLSGQGPECLTLVGNRL